MEILSFLGKKYNAYQNTIEVTEGEIAGKYMGSPWRAKRYTVPEQSGEMTELRFLGRVYKRNL